MRKPIEIMTELEKREHSTRINLQNQQRNGEADIKTAHLPAQKMYCFLTTRDKLKGS